MVGTAVGTRPVNGRPVTLEVEDTAHILLDFGRSRFAVVSTGNVIQDLRSPAIELYGESGVLQLRGEDFAPDGFERWGNERGAWEIYRETAPMWPWTDGIRHLVDCIGADRPPLLGPVHAFHVLEVALAATQASATGRTMRSRAAFRRSTTARSISLRPGHASNTTTGSSSCARSRPSGQARRELGGAAVVGRDRQKQAGAVITG